MYQPKTRYECIPVFNLKEILFITQIEYLKSFPITPIMISDNNDKGD